MSLIAARVLGVTEYEIVSFIGDRALIHELGFMEFESEVEARAWCIQQMAVLRRGFEDKAKVLPDYHDILKP